MHPNPAFRQQSTAQNLAFARTRGFGTLSINSDTGPLISHIPFVISNDGKFANLHLVRSNLIWRALDEPLPAVIAINGPDAYISPDWYNAPDQVPTWNYVAVHLRGTLEPRPADELHALLDALSGEFESRLAPKTPWTAHKMTPGARERMERMIAPCRLCITAIDGTWKLGQNKDPAARLGAANAVAKSGPGHQTADLANLMRDPSQDSQN